jgi:hypothetical protein
MTRSAAMLAGALACLAIGCTNLLGDFDVDGGSDSDESNDSSAPPEDTTSPPTDTSTPPPTDSGTPTDTAPSCPKPTVTSQCGPISECGCPPSQACVLASGDGSTKCQDKGTKGEMEQCLYLTTIDECDRGLSCALELCVKYCSSSSDCGLYGICEPSPWIPYDPTTVISTTSVCLNLCSPESPFATCGASNGCQFFPVYSYPHCARAGSAGQGESCFDYSSCSPGFWCSATTPGEAGAKCYKWCRKGVTADCPSPLTCLVSAGGGPTYAGSEYGVCQ